MGIIRAWYFWRFYSKLIKDKERQHNLVVADICFLAATKNVDKFSEKISGLRADLKVEQTKDNKDQKKINDIAYEIAEAEALQKKYQQMLAVKDELAAYVDLIKLWRKDVWHQSMRADQ